MIYSIANEELSVKVCDAGAAIISIKKNNKEYFRRSFDVLDGWAFNLFPIIGRLNQGIYTYKGKTYKMRRNGFLHWVEFDLVKREQDLISFEFKYNDYTLEMYPFKFLFGVTYKLIKNIIEIEYSVDNLDDKPIYFSIGAKPGFIVPISYGLNFEDYYVKFSEPKSIFKLELNSSYFLSGKVTPFELQEGRILPLSHRLFDNDALIFGSASRSISLESNLDPKSVKISYPDMPYIALWKTPKTSAPFLCIEPWAGLPSHSFKIDDIESKRGVIRLNQKQEYKNYWSIEIN